MNKKSGGQKRTDAERQNDLELIEKLAKVGLSTEAIRQAVNERYRQAGSNVHLSGETIRQDLHEIGQSLRERARDNMREQTAVNVAKLDYLETVLWDGFERSQQAKTDQEFQTITNEVAFAVDEIAVTHGTKIKKRLESADGDLAFLDCIGDVIRARCRLLGLYP